eukprot:GHVP01061219.1.p1 GENE.GHVP01061219.1~~GHVP01061219.1.p1  ORF type:complete len:1063 (-),score=188.81 GHVP01061219.1:1790-4915(-)
MSTKPKERKDLVKSLVYLYRKLVPKNTILNPSEILIPFLMILQTTDLYADSIRYALHGISIILPDINDRENILETVLAISFHPGEKEKDEAALSEMCALITRLFDGSPLFLEKVTKFYTSIIEQDRFTPVLKRTLSKGLVKEIKKSFKKDSVETIDILNNLLKKKSRMIVASSLSVLIEEVHLITSDKEIELLVQTLSSIIYKPCNEDLGPEILHILFSLSKKNTPQEKLEGLWLIGNFICILFDLITSDYLIEEAFFFLYRICLSDTLVYRVLFLEICSEYGNIGLKLISSLRVGFGMDENYKTLSVDIMKTFLSLEKLQKLNTKNCLQCLNSFSKIKSKAITLANDSLEDAVLLLRESDLFINSIGETLFNFPGIDKKVIGEYICKERNKDILIQFIECKKFSGLRVDEGLRSLLTHFKLPGEAQQIDRVIDTFGKIYFEQVNPIEISSINATICLAFSIMLLNTDQHNINMKLKRMTCHDYVRNLRGMNDGVDFSREYLESIFNAIREEPFSSGDKIELRLMEWKKSESFLIKTNKTMNKCNHILPYISAYTKFEQKLIESLEHTIITILNDPISSTNLKKLLETILLISLKTKKATEYSKTLILFIEDSSRDRGTKKGILKTLMELSIIPEQTEPPQWSKIITFILDLYKDKNVNTLLGYFTKISHLERENLDSLIEFICTGFKKMKIEPFLLEGLIIISKRHDCYLPRIIHAVESQKLDKTSKMTYLLQMVKIVMKENLEMEIRLNVIDFGLREMKGNIIPTEIVLDIYELIKAFPDEKSVYKEKIFDSILNTLLQLKDQNEIIRILLVVLPDIKDDIKKLHKYLRVLNLIKEREQDSHFIEVLEVVFLEILQESKIEDQDSSVDILQQVLVMSSSINNQTEATKLIIQILEVKNVKILFKNSDIVLRIYKIVIIPFLNKTGRVEDGSIEVEAIISLLEILLDTFKENIDINADLSFGSFCSLCYSVAYISTKNTYSNIKNDIEKSLRRFIVYLYKKEKSNGTRWKRFWNDIDFAVPGIGGDCEELKKTVLLPCEL